ncbi:MAG: DUF1501 domain-containing protein [Pseudomonadota bacterium]
MTGLNRRHFMLGTAASFAGASGILGSLTARPAHAADTTGYKALVCVFLKGGMDHADVILPLDVASHNALGDIRPGIFNAYNVDSSDSSRNRQNILPLEASNNGDFGGRSFGLPPEMAGLHSAFDAGEMAVVGNVGPLIEPTDRDSFENRSVARPARLFSHNDQQSTWMSLDVEGEQIGWGGRFADAVIASDTTSNPLYSVVTTGSNDVFLSGEQARQFRASGDGAEGLDIVERRGFLGGNSRFDAARSGIQSFFESQDLGHTGLYAQDLSRASADGVVNSATFRAALEAVVPFSAEFPDTSLGRQLRTVAETIDVRNSLNVSRQVFYVTTGGYDTHSNQVNSIPRLLGELSEALSAFRAAMVERNAWQDVTVFTASDFGRTTIDNGDGTDHGWGGHHFVLGGSVNGQAIYGDLPPADLSSSRYTESRGRLIPSVSVEQYAATLGSWFGLNAGELDVALPNLAQFSERDLGFLS